MCSLGSGTSKVVREIAQRGALVGFRTFDEGYGSLRSPIQYFQIKVGENRAEGPVDRYGVCGFYIFRTKREAERYELRGDILARVLGWGLVARHRKGFRASKMRVTALLVKDGEDTEYVKTLRRLARRYHVRVEKAVRR